MEKLNYPDYIRNNKPKRIYWKVVAGPRLSPIQTSDLIFDKRDMEMYQKAVGDNFRGPR